MARQETLYREGKLRGSKILYPDGQVGINMWYPFALLLDDHADDDEISGINFELDLRDIDDAIKLLSRLKDAEPDKLEDLVEEDDGRE